MLRGQQTLQRLVGKSKKSSGRRDAPQGILHTWPSYNLFPAEGSGFGIDQSLPPAMALTLGDNVGSPASLDSMLPASLWLPEDVTSGKPSKGLQFVTCPVCGRSVSSNNGALNAHLDRCLDSGLTPGLAKRKATTQLTLPRFGSWQALPSKRRKLTANGSPSISQSAYSLIGSSLESNGPIQEGQLNSRWTNGSPLSINSRGCHELASERTPVDDSSSESCKPRGWGGQSPLSILRDDASAQASVELKPQGSEKMLWRDDADGPNEIPPSGGVESRDGIFVLFDDAGGPQGRAYLRAEELNGAGVGREEQGEAETAAVFTTKMGKDEGQSVGLGPLGQPVPCLSSDGFLGVEEEGLLLSPVTGRSCTLERPSLDSAASASAPAATSSPTVLATKAKSLSSSICIQTPMPVQTALEAVPSLLCEQTPTPLAQMSLVTTSSLYIHAPTTLAQTSLLGMAAAQETLAETMARSNLSMMQHFSPASNCPCKCRFLCRDAKEKEPIQRTPESQPPTARSLVSSDVADIPTLDGPDPFLTPSRTGLVGPGQLTGSSPSSTSPERDKMLSANAVTPRLSGSAAVLSASGVHGSTLDRHGGEEGREREEDGRASGERLEGSCRAALATCVVGRRFHQQVACEVGLRVAARREPDNRQDCNAIQIVVARDLPEAVLGHLPREVAAHLAPLLDAGWIALKGSVTATPARPTAPAPIQLYCDLLPQGHSLPPGSLEEVSLLAAWGAAVSAAAQGPRGRQVAGPEVSPGEAPWGLYQANFAFMVGTVLGRDGHLFSEEEARLLGSFALLPGNAQRLFIRLYQRKGPWFRISSLDYADVEDVGAAVETLIGARFCSNGCDAEGEVGQPAAQEWLETLTVPELRALLCTAHARTKAEAATARREDLLAAARGAMWSAPSQPSCSGSGGTGRLLRRQLAGICGPCVRVAPEADDLLHRVQRVFFLNSEQDLAVFLLTDLGARKYPAYQCLRTGPVFPGRAELLAYEEALDLAQAMNEAVEGSRTAQALEILQLALARLATEGPGPYSQPAELALSPAASCHPFKLRFTAAWVYAAMGTLGVSVLERERRYSEAVGALRQLLASGWSRGRRGYWTVRLAVDLNHLGLKDESLRVAEAGVADTWVRGGDRLALQRRVVRLARPPRRWKRPPYAEAVQRTWPEVRILGRPLNRLQGTRSRFYGFDGQQCSVEALALQHYASSEGGGWEGVHAEGGIWRTLFGLLLWDALFAPVPDVFQTPFQTAPLDLSTDAFFPARQPLIEARLGEIRAGHAPQLLAHVWSQHEGTWCTGVTWERHSLAQLQTIAACVGGPGLAAVCLLLAQDHSGAGLPDLLLWRGGAPPQSQEALQGGKTANEKQSWQAPGRDRQAEGLVADMHPGASTKGRVGEVLGGVSGDLPGGGASCGVFPGDHCFMCGCHGSERCPSDDSDSCFPGRAMPRGKCIRKGSTVAEVLEEGQPGLQSCQVVTETQLDRRKGEPPEADTGLRCCMPVADAEPPPRGIFGGLTSCSGRRPELASGEEGSTSVSCAAHFEAAVSAPASGVEGEEQGEWAGVRGEARLVEVKGPRDRLSEQQRAWMALLLQAGLQVEVCKVVETEAELHK